MEWEGTYYDELLTRVFEHTMSKDRHAHASEQHHLTEAPAYYLPTVLKELDQQRADGQVLSDRARVTAREKTRASTMGKSVAKQLDFDSVETKANVRSVRDEQLLPTILKAFLKVFQAHPSQERIVRKYSNIGAFESVNQLLPALARDHEFNGGQDEAALMTTYDILNECMEALEEHEAEHVGADYDETKRSLSSRNRSQLRYTGAGRRLLNTTARYMSPF
jgi:hypothetical protein